MISWWWLIAAFFGGASLMLAVIATNIYIYLAIGMWHAMRVVALVLAATACAPEDDAVGR